MGKKSKSAKSKVIKIIIVSILGIILVSAIAAAYYFYVYKTPERVVKSMQEKMAEVKTFHYKSEMGFTGALEGIDTKVTFSLEGSSDETNKDNPKYSANLKINGTLLGTFILDAEADFKVLDKILYFKTSKVPSILALYGNTGSILDKWAQTEVNFGSNDNNGLGELIKKSDLFKDIEPLGSEKVEGQNTYHYKTILSKEVLSDFIDNNTIGGVLTPQEIQGIKSSIDALFEIPVELWISKKDNFLYKAKGSISTNEEEEKTTIDFLIVLTNFNEPVNIEAPDKSEPFNNVFGPFWENFKKLQSQEI